MTDNNSIDNTTCMDRYCSKIHDEYYCNARATTFECLSVAKELLACRQQDQSPTSPSLLWATRETEKDRLSLQMDAYEKHSQETLIRIWHIQCTIIVTLVAIAMAGYITKRRFKSWSQVFLVEFLVICGPSVVSVNVLNKYVEHILMAMLLATVLVVWLSKCLQRAAQREFEFGKRPKLFTLLRSTISLLTALCILAIDFESFPKKFRKSRRYGAGLMDVGIGLFVFSMGLVSPRPKRFADLRKLVFTVGCMLILGLARTVVITSIDYHQDEHEYGVHLNAFFTLGFTKLFATLFGLVARNDRHFLPLGIGKY